MPGKTRQFLPLVKSVSAHIGVLSKWDLHKRGRCLLAKRAKISINSNLQLHIHNAIGEMVDGGGD